MNGLMRRWTRVNGEEWVNRAFLVGGVAEHSMYDMSTRTLLESSISVGSSERYGAVVVQGRIMLNLPTSTGSIHTTGEEPRLPPANQSKEEKRECFNRGIRDIRFHALIMQGRTRLHITNTTLMPTAQNQLWHP